MKFFRLLTLALLIVNPSAHAWEMYPEYLGLTESEAVGFDNLNKVDSEYPSDKLTFTTPWWWWYAYRRQPQSLMITVGSLGSKTFMINNHLNLRVPLTEGFDFDLNYLDERDFERQDENFVLQLSKWSASKRFKLSAYGELESNKAQDDMGFALSYYPTSGGELKVFNTLVDFSRNERNSATDEFATAPKARGFVYRFINEDKKLLEISYRNEAYTEWLFPDELRKYNYSRDTAQVIWHKHLSHSKAFNLRFLAETKFEEEQPMAGASAIQQEYMRTDRYLLRTEYSSQRWDLGLHSAYRKYEQSIGEASKLHYLPYFVWRWGGDFHRWQLGYESTFFRETGSRLVRDIDADSYAVEHRFNLIYVAHFAELTQMRVLFTFDGDEFGTGETWEGGNVQFFTVF